MGSSLAILDPWRRSYLVCVFFSSFHVAEALSQSVQVHNDWVLGFWVRVIIVQVLGLGKYMIIRCLDS